MTDTEHKPISLLKHKDPGLPSQANFRAHSAMSWVPTHQVFLSQDTVPPSSRRVVAEICKDGYSGWLVDDSTDPDAAGQYYPDATTWRTIGIFYAKLTPGCFLEAAVTYIPAGMTEVNDGGSFIASGAQGFIRIAATWTGSLATRGPDNFDLAMGGSIGTFGALPSGQAAEWAAMQERIIPEIRPDVDLADPSILETWAEWVEVDIEIQVRGGARPHSITVYEVPFAHAQDHDATESEKSLHAYRIGNSPPQLINLHPEPRVSAADGATYQEGRFGTHQMMDVGARQVETLGPTVFAWSSFRNDPTDILASENQVISTSSTTFVDMFDSSITAWDADNPGFIVSAPYALLKQYSDTYQILRGKAAVLPVQVKLKGQGREGKDGTVRVQSSAVSWVDVLIPVGSETEVTAYGFLECQVTGDHAHANCQIFIRTEGAGGELDVKDVSVTIWAPDG